MKHLLTGLLVAGSLFSASSFAATVSWTDWQSSTANSANGQLIAGGQTITVCYSANSNHYFVQTGSGTNY